MNGVLATLSRELRAYFFSPLAYVVMALLLVVNGFIFAVIVSYLADPRYAAGRPMDLFFSTIWLTLLIVVPVLSMRLLAEERRSGSIEVLMTAPVSELEVVLGKYLAALIFYVALWAPTVVYPLLIALYGEVDWPPILAGYLGVLGIGVMLLAVGLFASAMSKSQIAAAIMTFSLLAFFFLFFGWIEGRASGAVKEALAYMDVLAPLADYQKGIVDTRSLVYQLSTAVFFLFLTTRALALKKWR